MWFLYGYVAGTIHYEFLRMQKYYKNAGMYRSFTVPKLSLYRDVTDSFSQKENI